MTLGWMIFTFINIWWVALFSVISVGNTHARTVAADEYAAAPDKPNFKKKFILTSIISAILTAIAATLMDMGIISFV